MNSTPKKFQRKLILYNLMIIICIASAISIYNYRSYRNDVIKNETTSSASRINALSDRLELAYDEMINILLNCSERKSLFVTTTFSDYQDGYDNAKAALYASSALKDLCAISGYSRYIFKITLFNNDFVLQAGNSNGSLDDPYQIMATPWFHDTINNTAGQYTLRMVDNPFPFGKTYMPKLLPLLRPLQNITNAKPENSWVFLGISPTLYLHALQTMPRESIVYAVTAEGDIISSVRGGYFDTDTLIQDLLASNSFGGSYRAELNQKDCIITYKKQPISGILLFEILPIISMDLDHSIIGNTIFFIFLFCIVIGMTLSLVISKQLGAPISRLTRRLELISRGNFEPDITIESDDEIGMIGKQINEMSTHISNLLETRVQNEKDKKDLEIKMLQAQINPHFLYNTLDSIKWIATMQRNSGIVQVVTSLSSLLKNMAKGFNEKVTLRQELDFLNHYITIEKIRYIELFDVDVSVEDERLYDAKIIKLTLQPIVENAIFSGIEPSGRFGFIQIRAFVKDGLFTITVLDNGIGIAPENIKALLTDTSRVSKSKMSGIGLPNVDRRMKLVYGEDYGITIESKLDNYTKITITLPLEY